MTFSSLIVLFLTHKINYSTKKVVQKDLNYDTLFNIQKYIKNFIKIVFIIEFTGAVFLFFVFIKRFSFLKAVYYAVFHSISAFCNTGFSLFPSSLKDYQTNIIINIVIPALIILGSLGFAALNNIYMYVERKFEAKGRKKRKFKMNLTSKLSIKVSLILIIGGTLSTLMIEMSNPETLKNFDFHNKILLSFFHSVSIRTAGFQTLELSGMKTTTLLVYIILMFIGASPGSTGSGIKTTTIAVIILGIFSLMKGKKDIEVSGRRINWIIFNRAVSIVFISILYVIVVVFILSILEKEAGFLVLLFEVVSAFGTAGLSLNMTPELCILSKLLISVTMFVGRVGPLTVAIPLVIKARKVGIYRYPKEDVYVG